MTTPTSGRPGVSIPQSGFGAFEPALPTEVGRAIMGFQSLSRDSGRLNPTFFDDTTRESKFQSLSRDSGRLNICSPWFMSFIFCVSIPQSGFGAFEQQQNT